MEQSQAVTLLRAALPTFRETLHALGYADVFVMARPLAHLSPEKSRQFEALAAALPASVRLLDVRV